MEEMDPLKKINLAELYPRRRRTEFYSEPQPPEHYQSRKAEHPSDKLNNFNTNKDRIPQHIVPPSNSNLRLLRDSYFT